MGVDRFHFLFFELGLKTAGFHYRKYKKSFLLRKYNKLFNVRVRKLHFLEHKEIRLRWICFFFLSFGLKDSFLEIFSRFLFPEISATFLEDSIHQNIIRNNRFFNIRARKFYFPRSKAFSSV